MAKIIYNDIIPFKGFQAITILPFIFARKKYKELAEHVVNHESIHIERQLEVLVVASAVMASAILAFGLSWWWMCISLFAYYILYCTEYVIRLCAYGRRHEAYSNISFEQEAFLNERDFCYPKSRMTFAWGKYLTRKSFKR